MNVFTRTPKEKNQIKKNTFDWSHANNFTTGIGRITPVFTELLPAGGSVKIKPTFALKFMPMQFPVQTPIKARLSVFKYPLRALWSGYRDFISGQNLDENIPPYISNRAEYGVEFDKVFGTGSLGDSFGLPSTYDVESETIPLTMTIPTFNYYKSGTVPTNPLLKLGKYSEDSSMSLTPITNLIVGNRYIDRNYTLLTSEDLKHNYTWKDIKDRLSSLSFDLNVRSSGNSEQFAQESTTSIFIKPSLGVIVTVVHAGQTYAVAGYGYKQEGDSVVSTTEFNVDSVNNYTIHLVCKDSIVIPSANYPALDDTDKIYFNVTGLYAGAYENPTAVIKPTFSDQLPQVIYSEQKYSSVNCPWYNPTTKKGLKLSAYPWRAYNGIYNAYYRDIRNNPLVVNGKEIYNDYVVDYAKSGDEFEGLKAVDSTLKDGDIINKYLVYKYSNWEPDMFTTSVQSPQQGQAPLVGLTTYSRQTLAEDGVTTVNVLNNYITDENGNSYEVKFNTDKEGLKGVEYSKVESLPSTDPLANMYEGVTQGIRIEDFRDVNAYQRYLELNMRRGYSYKDIIEGRFDVNVRYDDLLMPEYCGGITRDVVINPITQDVSNPVSDGSYLGALGSQAGDSYCFGQSDQSITVYCEEESIVMALLTVQPKPVYTQNLPKHFLYRSNLDHYNPEFAQIGFQPIKNAEVAPIQAWNSTTGDKDTVLQQTFGYQRPWYEYLQKVDTAHGLFRTQLRNFLMNRTFEGLPQLSTSFLTVNPDDVNQVFSVTEISDKIIGQIYFDATAKLPIPMDSVPRLE